MTPKAQSFAIIREVAAKHGVSMEALLGPFRSTRLIIARQEAAQRLAMERRLSHTQIAKYLNRDQSTISDLRKRRMRYLERVTPSEQR